MKKKQRGGTRPKRLTEEQREQIRAWVDDDASMTLQAITARCMNELNVEVSITTVERYLREFHYSLKRIHALPQRRNDEVAIESRAEYARNFLQLVSTVDQNRFVFIDEVGFCVSMRARRGRSLQGTRAVQVVSGL